MRALVSVAAMVASLPLQFVVCAPADAAGIPRVIVAVVEPDPNGAESDPLGFSVALGESKLTNALTVLNGLARPAGEQLALDSQPLAILIHMDVSIGAVGTLVSMATKAGYSADNIFIFFFDEERRSMMESAPGFRNMPFSTDPDVIGGYVGR